LRNSLERAVLSCKGPSVDTGDLPQSLAANQDTVTPKAPAWEGNGSDLDEWLADVERRAIQQALAQTNGVQAHAARLLGVTERSLWHRIKKLGIHINRVVN
jgi:DNA-binding NtrC family response regulator